MAGKNAPQREVAPTRHRVNSSPMDDVDLLALRLIAQNGRMTWAELAQHMAMTGPAAAERIRRLEERGIIRGYAAIVDRQALGYDLTAFVSVDLIDASRRAEFLMRIESIAEVLECHHVTGDHDYLLKVACRSPQHLDQLLNEHIKQGNVVARTRTVIALGTPKESLFSPIARNEDRR